MKNILLVCRYSNIDISLRRSLAHLVNSCYIEITPGGHQALDILSTKTFDLIIIDSALIDIDCLELVESIEYLDPGLPVILMLRQEHRLLWSPAQSLGADPILRPFKPLGFLRLVDRLLHQQLERYRELAKTLELALTTLSSQIQAPLAFLADGAGSILLSTAATDDPLPASLTRLVVAHLTGEPLEPHEEGLIASPAEEADRELYCLAVTENLYLAALLPAGMASPLIPIWLQLEVTGYAIREAFIEYELIGAALEDQPFSALAHEVASPDRFMIPLRADLNQAPLPEPESSDEENLSVNWQIISNDSAILNRLQSFCQIS